MSSPAAPAAVSTLLRVFVLWKAVLLLLAAGSLVGPRYDASSSLSSFALDADGRDPPGSALFSRFLSWDAQYFIQISRRGYLYEQEWAFGIGLPTVISSVLKALESLGLAERSSIWEAIVGVIFAHVSHLLSVLVLFWLGRLVWRDQKLALVAACLHILSPAGLFLSAPYSESPFSLFSFAGHLFFAKSGLASTATARDAFSLAAGSAFGLATAFRSNGILNGIPFLYEFVKESVAFLAGPSLARARRVIVLGIGGLCVAAGSVIPQVLAYLEYCTEGSRRPWCDRLVPSIYTFVQAHYWHIGLFRYWTFHNIGLFLLTAPMLLILMKSGWDSITATTSSASRPTPADAPQDGCVGLIRSLAAAQMLLAILAVTSYHVQIIMRLSSAYPVWYWWLARCLGSEKDARMGKGIVVFMIMYASIQAILFSSFLPPA